MSDSDRILILLATFNGGKFLEEQLNSFLSQSDSKWDLLVSDDGSTDSTLKILEGFKEKTKGYHTVQILRGPQAGHARNFLSLIARVPEATSFIAFSDQDDVWLPQKLSRARAKIEAAMRGSAPILYAASSYIYDEARNIKKRSPTFRRAPSFGNALVQSIGGGNTMMLNAPAIKLLKAAAQEADAIVVHDWWIYQIISGCGGVVIRDPEPMIYYRQHEGNSIGANRSLQSKLERIRQVSERRYAGWNEINISTLQASHQRLTPEAQNILSHFSKARHGGPLSRLLALYRSGVYRQTILETVALYLACSVRRL
ncbi:glycosyltransferase family 2 protein [Celeribacter halophilus]|uniref:glycosyltransferase family 2 protein n=1 Tax=Celeribacter halophilus TaxID=576117 RepID=UPI001C08B4F9|nr:glycosyltransferase family 2 protein [Celeribacter halophilus]MBU2888862.1 glycosyltransferase family 2 protein [Celeribacter halophilus]MDO6511980.1 glycosyltransferase family 2 protein [Celeribacter halophilus]